MDVCIGECWLMLDGLIVIVYCIVVVLLLVVCLLVFELVGDLLLIGVGV